MLSAQVKVQPQLPGLTVDALPKCLLKRTALSKCLPRDAWGALRKVAYTGSGMK